MMVQIDNEIKFHSHEEVEREVGKLSHAGKKMAGEIKALREDNQFILARLQNISTYSLRQRTRSTTRSRSRPK